MFFTWNVCNCFVFFSEPALFLFHPDHDPLVYQFYYVAFQILVVHIQTVNLINTLITLFTPYVYVVRILLNESFDNKPNWPSHDFLPGLARPLFYMQKKNIVVNTNFFMRFLDMRKKHFIHLNKFSAYKKIELSFLDPLSSKSWQLKH